MIVAYVLRLRVFIDNLTSVQQATKCIVCCATRWVFTAFKSSVSRSFTMPSKSN